MAFDPIKYSQVYNSFNVELCFEFNSYYSVEKTQRLLKEHLGKEIVLENSKEFTCDDYVFQMRTNPVFKDPYIQLVTGKLSYQEARFVIIKMFEKIREFGFTNVDNFLRVKLSTTEDQQMIPALSRIDRLKYILDFDQSLLWTKFDNLKNSAFVRSVYHIVPINRRMKWNVNQIIPNEFEVPMGNLYGIDFTKLTDGSIGFNYIGGERYEKKPTEALDCLDYYILSIAKTVTTNYDEKNKAKLWSILDDLKSVLQGYESPEKFKEQFPDLKISVDMSDNEQILKTHWNLLRDKIFDLLVNSDIKEGYINYDTSLSRFQMKEMKFTAFEICDFEIIDCEITNSHIKDCYVYRSIIRDSRINKTNHYASTDIYDCKAKDSYFNSTTEIFDSYIHGKSTVINGIMTRGILREGNVGKMATIKSSVKVVEYTEIKPTKLKIN